MERKNRFDKAWINEHINDPYVLLAQKEGYRSRAAYKLIEIDKIDNIFKEVKVVLDLGCAPGSWSQVVLKKIGKNGLLCGVDLLQIEPVDGLNFILGDFTENQILELLTEALQARSVDLVLSDMSPNLSGIKMVDQARFAYLFELVIDFNSKHLKKGGTSLIKVFQGAEFTNLVKLAKTIFSEVIIRKPLASKAKSSESYLLCKNKKF